VAAATAAIVHLKTGKVRGGTLSPHMRGRQAIRAVATIMDTGGKALPERIFQGV